MRRATSWAIFVLVCLAAWFFAGPTQLGGPASYVVVDGDSMEPTYSNGDLVVARQATAYAVGDVITYDAPIDTQFSVIHRITEVVDGGYVTQGDNRDEPDGWLAPEGAIHGSTWFHIPRGGLLVGLLRQPSVLLALVAGWITVALLTRREGRGTDAAAGEAGTEEDSSETAKAGGATALVSVATILGLLAGIGVAHAASLTVDGGVIQAFALPVDIDVPDAEPDEVTIWVQVRKYNSGNGDRAGNKDERLTATITVGTQYQVVISGGSGTFVVCPEGDDPLPEPAAEDEAAGSVRTATEDVTHVVCTQTGGSVELRTGDAVIDTATSDEASATASPDATSRDPS